MNTLSVFSTHAIRKQPQPAQLKLLCNSNGLSLGTSVLVSARLASNLALAAAAAATVLLLFNPPLLSGLGVLQGVAPTSSTSLIKPSSPDGETPGYNGETPDVYTGVEAGLYGGIVLV